MEASRKQSRGFWEAAQPAMVRLYKIAGLLALTAILLGLLGFLVVNVFYFFDHTWVRPVALTPNHPKVVEASTQVNDAKLRASQLDAEQLEIKAQLEEIDRSVAADDKFLAEVGTSVDAPKTPDQWLVRRELERAKLDKDNQAGKKAPLASKLDSIGKRIKEQKELVAKLEQSPYLRAADHNITLAFVPYENLRNVKLGTKLYSCSWGLVNCSRVGKVKATIDGEVENIHPHDETIRRGVLVEIELSTPSAAEANVLFAGGKPLWLF
ncbi:MAG: hypothetical protein QM831_15615 [Kofleriaceae bacterium]